MGRAVLGRQGVNEASGEERRGVKYFHQLTFPEASWRPLKRSLTMEFLA